MSRITQRALLIPSDEERKHLESLSPTLKAPLREIQWAKTLLTYSVQRPIQDIAREIGVSRQTVYKCLDKALSMGWEAELSDFYHRPKEPVITRRPRRGLFLGRPPHQGRLEGALHIRPCPPLDLRRMRRFKGTCYRAANWIHVDKP